MTCILPRNEVTFSTVCTFCSFTAKIILASTISLFNLLSGRIHFPHSGLILHDISKAYSAICSKISIRHSGISIRLCTSLTRYLIHRSFFSAWYSSNVRANLSLYFSSYWILVSIAGIKAISVLLFAIFPITTFFWSTAFVFF